MDFHTFSSRVLDDCLQLGARAAEVYFKSGGSADIKMYQGRVTSVVSAEEEGIGIRFVLPGGRMGYAYTSEASPASVTQVIEEAIRGAEEGDEITPTPELPGAVEGLPTGDDLGIHDTALRTTPLSQRVDLVREIESAAMNSDGRIQWVDTLIYNDGWAEIWLRNTSGFEGRYRKTLCHASISVLARDDEEAILSYHTVASPILADLKPEAVGSEAGRRAAAPLRGRRLSPRKVTAVLEPHVAARVLEFLAPSLLADQYQRGRSLFDGMVGEEVASSCLTLVDDSRLKGGVSTSPFDGEGSPTGRTVLVEGGVLRRLLHDRASAAREEKAETTGNSVRASFTEPPSLGVTNLMLQPGEEPVASVLSGLGGAFRVVNIMNVGGVNPVTGSFSVAASGVWMEKGRDAHPVAGVTLSGNLREMVRQIVAVGDDLRWEQGRGSFGCPTLVVEGLTLAG